MSGGNRSGKSKIGLIVGLLVAFPIGGLLIGYGNLEAAKYEQQARTQTQEFASYTRHKMAKSCVALPAAERSSCMDNAEDLLREQAYNQQDLVAQKHSALWAYIMALAAVIGMILSAVGVWLIKTTFDEAQRSNEIAKSAGRPWIDFSPQENGHLTIEFDKLDFNVSIKLRNHGGRPAIGVIGRIHAFLDKPTRSKVWESVKSAHESIADTDDIRIVFPDNPSDIRLEGDCKIGSIKHSSLFFVVSVSYSDGDNPTRNYTAIAFMPHIQDASILGRVGDETKVLFHGHQNVQHITRFMLHPCEGVTGEIT